MIGTFFYPKMFYFQDLLVLVACQLSVSDSKITSSIMGNKTFNFQMLAAVYVIKSPLFFFIDVTNKSVLGKRSSIIWHFPRACDDAICECTWLLPNWQIWKYFHSIHLKNSNDITTAYSGTGLCWKNNATNNL